MKTLLFDLGGVVIDIDFKLAFASFEKISALSADEIKSRFKMDGHYKQHETGQIAWPQYAEHLRGTFELKATDEDIANAWNSIFKGEIRQTVAAIESVKDDYQCYLFSNTNPTHQHYWQQAYPDVIALFSRVFVSSQLGLRKPDVASFKFIADTVNTELKDFIFFDDTQENIDAALTIGMQAILVDSPDSVESALERIS